jgi:ATP-dependent RNA helicase DDX51/DBP6
MNKTHLSTIRKGKAVERSINRVEIVLIHVLNSKFHGGSSKVDILITTPGRLIDHISSTPNFTLQHLRFLVIDEADRLLNQSYNDWLNQILQATRPETRENLPFIDFQTNKNG